MTITFVGHGYVGLVTACVFADLGNTVYVIGRSDNKLKKLKGGDPLIFEPGLSELLKKNLKAKRLLITKYYDKAVATSSIVFIAVGTPPKLDGEADLSAVTDVVAKVGQHLTDDYTVISCKSTVPVGTNRRLLKILREVAPTGASFDVASCPEFLREGSALSDTFSPDRIIIGTDSKKACNLLIKLHKPLDGERVLVGIESAELIKYASNSILATKISFANLVSLLCEKFGADVQEVLDGVGLDRRIGRAFLSPGLGYGGSCFPKDVKALISTGESASIDMSLLKAVNSINETARKNFLKKILKHIRGKTIGIWGLSFKPNTDDIRDAPAISILPKLLEAGFLLKVYDPEAMDNTKKQFRDRLRYCSSPYEAVKDVHLLCIMTEWNEFKQINLSRVKKLVANPVIVDGRNIYEPKIVKRLGFTYISTGRA